MAKRKPTHSSHTERIQFDRSRLTAKFSNNADRAFTSLRASVQTVLIEHDIDENWQTLIGELVTDRDPKHDAECEAIEAAVEAHADYETASKVSDHFGAVASAYGTAGFFVGLCAAFELAALRHDVPKKRVPKNGGGL
jgi:hypothetical protein